MVIFIVLIELKLKGENKMKNTKAKKISNDIITSKEIAKLSNFFLDKKNIVDKLDADFVDKYIIEFAKIQTALNLILDKQFDNNH